MFTGIVQEIGRLKERITSAGSYQLKIEARKVLDNINKGDSIAVNGVCLTVVNFTGNSFTADVMPETLRATNLSRLNIGSGVNLEQAVRPDGFFGGHMVTGHVDGLGELISVTPQANARILTIKLDRQLTDLMVDKGSVAINGVSLTIIRVSRDQLTVSLIPETWNFTNLYQAKTGEKLNIETDLIGKYIFKMIKGIKEGEQEISGRGTGINKNFLQSNGFL